MKQVIALIFKASIFLVCSLWMTQFKLGNTVLGAPVQKNVNYNDVSYMPSATPTIIAANHFVHASFRETKLNVKAIQDETTHQVELWHPRYLAETSIPTPTPSIQPSASVSVSPSNNPSHSPTPSTTPSDSLPNYGRSLNGCVCRSRCATSLDTLVPWCVTQSTCVEAKYDGIRRQYWDQCVLDSSEKRFVADVGEAWSAMVIASILCGAGIHAIAGIQAWRASFREVNLRSLLWLPVSFMIFGAVTSFVFSSVGSLLIIQMYFAMPYAIPTPVAYALGCVQSICLMYVQLQRWYMSPPKTQAV